MASVYTNLKKGSSGSDVTALQTALNQKGYALQNTGLYDDATEAAVRKYQQDSGLTVDGVAGDATLGALYGKQNAQAGFVPSDQLTQAQQYAQQVQQQKPGAYQSAYTPQLQAQFDAIMNRQPFQYDLGTDAMFRQMGDMYTQQGRRAMQDAMGMAAEMTGGYGNSYAQGAGQAAYGNYLQNLYAMAPEFQQQAFNRWQSEGADMMDRYNAVAAREENDYARYQNALNNYWAEADRAQQAADTLYNREYGAYQDQQNWQMQQEDMAFQREQYNSKLNSENREYAYNLAMMMLQGGQMPSADVLAAAGISAADAAALQSMYKPKSSGSYTPKSNVDTEKSVKDIQSLTDAVALVSGAASLTAKTGGEAAGTPSNIMTFQQWTEKNPAPKSNGIKSVSTNAEQMEKYEDYVSDTIEKEYKNGKLSVLDALKLTAQYLPSKR